jgi:pimeloyl-ACP methyl ester carboxylesterase
MYFPPAFVLSDAQLAATLVLAAYDQFDQWKDQSYPSQPSFNWSPSGPSTLSYSAPIWSNFKAAGLGQTEPFGFVAWDQNGNVYAVLRGTMTLADGWIDAEVDQTAFTLVSGGGNVHEGFLAVYSGLREQLLNEINSFTEVNNLYIAGHSLGSALASLAAADLPVNATTLASTNLHYNFASPRVGDPTFAAMMNAAGVRTFRVVNTEDAVPAVPPAITGSILYEHFGLPVDFTAQYGSLDGNHSMANCYNYAITNPDAPQGPVSTVQNLLTAQANRTGKLPAGLPVPPVQPAEPIRPAKRDIRRPR